MVKQRFDILGEFYGYAGRRPATRRLPAGRPRRLKMYLAKLRSWSPAPAAASTGSPTRQADRRAAVAGFLGFIFEPNIGDRDGDGIRTT